MKSQRLLRAVLVCLGVALGAAARAEAPPEPGWKVTWWPKLEVESPDGAHRVRFGGRLLLDGGMIRYDQDLERRKSPAAWTERSELRQGRVYTNGVYFHDRVELKVEGDFARDNDGLTDAYLGLRRLGPLGTARFGHQKVPFSLEQAMSRLHMVFIERSLAQALDPSVRDLGLKFTNTHWDGRLYWAVGGFRDTNSTGVSFRDDHNWSVGGRVTGLPLWREEGRKLLHIGVSYGHEFREQRTLRIRRTPETFLGDELVDTGTIRSTRDGERIGIEAAWQHGPFALQAESNHVVVGRRGGTLHFWGWYATASWFVTGEHRPYQKSGAVFGPLVPKAHFDPRKGDWGALQLAFRISGIDLNDRDIRGGKQTDKGFGLNWFPHTNLRFTLNYVRARVNGQGDADVLQGRFQVWY